MVTGALRADRPERKRSSRKLRDDAGHVSWLEPVRPVGPGNAGPASLQIEYAYAAAGTVKPSWVARPLFGGGSFKTKSLRGLLFASTVVAPMACIALLAAIVWLMLFVNRAVTTADLAFFVVAAGIGWILCDFVRQLWWLLADRIVPAADVLVSWNEPPAQLESFKQGDARIIWPGALQCYLPRSARQRWSYDTVRVTSGAASSAAASRRLRSTFSPWTGSLGGAGRHPPVRSLSRGERQLLCSAEAVARRLL